MRVLHLDWRLGLVFAFANLILVVRALRFVWNRVGHAEAAHIPRRSASNMEKQPGSQGTSDSMWPVSSGAPREQRAPLTTDDALRPGSAPAHDVLDRGMPLSIFQRARASSDPAQLLQPSSSADPGKTKEDAASEDLGIALPLENSAIRFAPPKLPEWFWRDSSTGSREAAQAGAVEQGTPATTEATSGVASRLSALRGAVSALGMKNLGRRREVPAPDRGESAEALAHVVEAETVAALSTEVPARLAEQMREQPADARTTISVHTEEAVAPEPQKIAPREFVPVKKRDASDEWDASDVRILPSRRGQYER